MFGGLKDKLKKALKKFKKEVEEAPEETKEIEEEEYYVKEEPEEVEEEIPKEEIGEIKEVEKKPEIKEVKEEPKEEKPEEIKEEVKEPEIKKVEKKEVEEPKGFFQKVKKKIITKKISEDKFNELFWDLELGLLENNVAVEVIEKIKQSLKMDLVNVPIERANIEKRIEKSLKNSVAELFDYREVDFVKKVKEKKPYVIMFLGINGGGKTTTIAKIAKLLQDNGLSCVLGAADTFRAAAIEQIGVHGDKLGVKVIRHDYGADPAAVAFDCRKYAENKDVDVVLIDTAGRMHSNLNLMEELKKIDRVVKPDMKIFVGESITGNDCVEQAKRFNEAVGVDGMILTKSDVDEKGGAAVSISFVTGKPILYLGTGQEYKDIEKFNLDKLMKGLGF